MHTLACQRIGYAVALMSLAATALGQTVHSMPEHLLQPVPAVAAVDLTATPAALQSAGTINGLGVRLYLGADNVGLGPSTVLALNHASSVYANVVGNNPNVPPGVYRVRFNLSNLLSPASVNLRSVGTAAACAVPAGPAGTIQPCDMLVNFAGGTQFQVSLAGFSGPAQLLLLSVQLFKQQ